MKWAESMSQGFEQEKSDSAPMEVGRIVKGKGKDSKGKGKGKGKKGKSESKHGNSWDRGQGQGKGGSYVQNCDNKGNKGKGKGKEKGKDKGKYSRDSSQIICHKCGKPGHYARGCTMNDKVRQIQSASTMPHTPAPSSSASAATNSVGCVRHADSPRQTLVLDLEPDEFAISSTRFVRMIGVENFYIGSDNGHFETCEGIVEHCLLEEQPTSSFSVADLDIADYEVVEHKMFPAIGDRIQIELESDVGSLLVLKDKGHLSASVSQPLVSYRRLLKRGWVITLVDGAPKLLHMKTGSSVRISFRNDSLVITGSIRRVEHVRCQASPSGLATTMEEWG